MTTNYEMTRSPYFLPNAKILQLAALIEPSYVVIWVVGTHRYVLTTIRSLWSANKVIAWPG